MSLIEYTSLFSAVILGGGLAFYLGRYDKKVLQLVLSFSGAYILGITFLHLVPEAFHDANTFTGLWVMAGFLIQLFLEQFSGGIEHGHIHAHSHAGTSYAMTVMIGLCLHAFMEGMPLGISEIAHEHAHSHHHHNHNNLLLGIILHKAPAAFALVLLLLFSDYNKKLIWLLLVVFALMSPLGAFSTSLFTLDAPAQQAIIALVIGTFLHISTTIIFEMDNEDHHKISYRRMFAILVGIGLSVLTVLL